MRNNYVDIPVDEDSVKHMAAVGNKTLPRELKYTLDLPITMVGLHLAMGKGSAHKAPGSDGVCQEFVRPHGTRINTICWPS